MKNQNGFAAAVVAAWLAFSGVVVLFIDKIHPFIK
jgi:hypothetical protein